MSEPKDTKGIFTKINEYFKKNNIQAEVVDKSDKLAKLFAFKKEEEGFVKPEKFEDITLADGTTVVTVDPAVEVGAAIVVTTPEGVIPAPINTKYPLPDGSVIVVADQAGIIAEVVPAEMPAGGEGAPVVDADMGGVDEKVKRLIERVEKVTEFEKETKEKLAESEKENDFLHKEIDALKEKNTSLEADISEFKKIVQEGFTALMGEPDKKPVVENKNPLAKEEKPNIFLKQKTN